MEEVKSPICPECGNQESLRTLAIDDKIVWVCQECSKVFRGDEGDWWTCS